VQWQALTRLRVPDVKLVQRLDQPQLGAGEAAAAPVPAALANAIFDATGVHLRTVPFTRERVKPLFAGPTRV
jgi:nicotinate dehydrogenase subunit B